MHDKGGAEPERIGEVFESRRPDFHTFVPGASKTYRDNYTRIFGKRKPLIRRKRKKP